MAKELLQILDPSHRSDGFVHQQDLRKPQLQLRFLSPSNNAPPAHYTLYPERIRLLSAVPAHIHSE